MALNKEDLSVTLPDGRQLQFQQDPIHMSDRGNTVERASLNGDSVCVKAVPNLNSTRDHARQLDTERRALQRLAGCEHIVQLRESTYVQRFWRRSSGQCQTAARPSAEILVLDYHENGDLYSILDPLNPKASPVPERIVQRMALQLLRGLRLSHSQGVAHRDIKPENVLITAEGDFVLADFGLAHVLPRGAVASADGMLPAGGTPSSPVPRSVAGRVRSRPLTPSADFLSDLGSDSEVEDYPSPSGAQETKSSSARARSSTLREESSRRRSMRPIEIRCTGEVGTALYMAPEIAASRTAYKAAVALGRAPPPPALHDAAKTDVWSLGCVIFTALFGHPPFKSAVKGKDNYFFNRIHRAYKKGLAGDAPGAKEERNKFWRYHLRNFGEAHPGVPLPSEAFRAFLDRIFEESVSRRATVEDLLRHAWIDEEACAGQGEALSCVLERQRPERGDAAAMSISEASTVAAEHFANANAGERGER